MKKIEYNNIVKHNNYIVSYSRVKNDVNGNPRYKLTIINELECNTITTTITSYNIDDSIITILDKISHDNY